MVIRKKEIKLRILRIVHSKKPVFGAAVAVLITAMILAACTGGKVSEEPIQDIQESQDPLDSDQVTNGEFPANEDGSYRLSEYKVELTGDKIQDQIVFDVYYYADLESMAEVITEELLWQELWNGCHVEVRVINGESDQVIWEKSFSEAHAGNGNLAVVRYEGQNCLMSYRNLMYQEAGQLYYKIFQVQANGEEPLILKESQADYGDGFTIVNDEEMIAKVLEVGEELDRYLIESGTKVLLNASSGHQEDCYLRSSKGVMLNGEKNQTSVDVFRQELSGNGWELTLQDFFYPNGMESLTVLPEDAEARILAGEVFFMEVSEDNTTAGRLDLDGDGIKEVIHLYALSHWPGISGWHYWSADTPGYIDVKYRFRVNEHYLEDYCDIMAPVVMAYSPDGEEILLALYDDGPSSDPETMFFRYDDTGLHPAGSIPADLREVTDEDSGMRSVTIEDGLIRCSFRADMIQSEWAWGYYEWNGSEIMRREDEIYYYCQSASGWREEYNIPLVLLREITVFSERSESSEAFVLKPQEVRNVATDHVEWILLEGRDGTKGWIRVEDFSYFPSEEASSLELFEGLSMVD